MSSANPPAKALDDTDFRLVSAMLEERCGLLFHAGNRDILDGGLARVAEAEHQPLPVLVRRLMGPTSAGDSGPPGDDLMQRVIQAVTICETYFFRHPEQFAVLGEHAIPQLLHSGRKRLRAWSAGCATGEEAYSLAMMMSAAALGTEVQVLGTDLNQASLRQAERARYGRHSLRVPSLLLDAFLQPLPNDEFEVLGNIRKLVSFRSLNLRDPSFPVQFAGSEAFDIILCRNVLVYFAPSLVAPILARLRDCLTDGGFLCVSALDYTNQIPGLEVVLYDGVPLLRRCSPPAGRAPAPWPSRLTPAISASASRVTPATSPLRRTMPGAMTSSTNSSTASSGAVAALERPSSSSGSAASGAIAAAKLAADEGRLDSAAASARDALAQHRSPEALHLLALVLGEKGQTAEMEALLREAIERNPAYVLGHLSLGLLERPPATRWRSAHHLKLVIELLRNRRDDEILHGPESLQVAMARRLARAGLENLERRH